MSSNIDDSDFARFLASDNSPEEFFDGLDRNQQAADQPMSGMNQTSSPQDSNLCSSLIAGQHSPSQPPDESHLQQNQPNMSTPEPKREESEGFFLPDIPYVPPGDDVGRRTGLEDDGGEEHFGPDSAMDDNSLHLPELASPINFGSLPSGVPFERTTGGNSRRNASVSPSPEQQEPVHEPTQPITTEGHNDRASPSPPGNDNLGTQVEQIAIENDDIAMINAEDSSPNAPSRWAVLRNPTVLEKSIKQEARDGVSIRLPTPVPVKPVNFQQMMAAQKAMIQGSLQKKDATKASMFGGRKSVEAESSHRRRPSFAQIGDEHENAKAAMGDADDDDLSWMNDDDVGRDEEYENLVSTRNALQRRQKNGKITQDEKLELYNIQKRIESKDRVKRAVACALDEEEEEESLFVPEEREHVVERHIRDRPTKSTFQTGDSEDEGFSRMLQESISGEGLGGPGNTKQTKGRPRKKATGKRPVNAREFRQQEEAKREKERAKAQKGKRGSAAKGGGKKAAPAPKGKGKGKAANNGKAANRSGVTTRSESLLRPGGPNRFNNNSGQDAIGQMILEDLLLNDPVNDRLNDPIFDQPAEEPIEGPQRKSSQFQKLFANIPSGGNSRAVRDDKKKLQEASRSFGYAKVRAVNGKWLVKGMKSPLYHHQLLGAQWMVTRELSAEPPHGGLLADSMGLGKTVQTLACMVGNPPTPEDLKRNVKATLIVVPAAVLDQWMDEIEFHTEQKVFKKVQRYKTSAQISEAVLQDMDIVVTTYNEVMRQFPYPDKKERLAIETIGYQQWWKQALENVGDLHRVNWYRIVLDEAHAIKNNAARTSLACQNLKSVYRWCLTGTPLLNRLEE
jgi:hypothetical protein